MRFINSVNQVDKINYDNCIQGYLLPKGFGQLSVPALTAFGMFWQEGEGLRTAWVMLTRPCLKKTKPNAGSLG